MGSPPLSLQAVVVEPLLDLDVLAVDVPLVSEQLEWEVSLVLPPPRECHSVPVPRLQ